MLLLLDPWIIFYVIATKNNKKPQPQYNVQNKYEITGWVGASFVETDFFLISDKKSVTFD